MKKILLSLLLSFCLLWADGTKAVKMEVATTEILASERFELTISIENFDGNISFQEPPELNTQLNKVQGPFQSQSTTVINGKMTKSIVLTYHFNASKTGTINISPAKVVENGKTYQSNSLQLKIVKSEATSQNRGNQPFVVAHPSQTQLYLGEMTKLDFVLYLPQNAKIRVPSIVDDPRILGFVVTEATNANQARSLIPKLYNGVRYNTLLIKSVWLTASNSGKQTISPLILKVPIEEKNTKKRRRSAFDDPFFDDDIFSGYSRSYNELSVQSQPFTITVKDLPSAQNYPSFNGAVGSFRVNSSINTTQLKVNESLTIKTVIEGVGNLQNIKAPKFEISNDFEIYDPVVKISNTAPNSGRVTVEQVCIPRFAGKQKIKGGSFTFFNSKSGKYEIVNLPDFEVDVNGTNTQVRSSESSMASLNQRDVVVTGNDIRYLKKELSALYSKKNRAFNFLNFYLWILLFVLIPLIAYALKITYLKANFDKSLIRNKKASTFAAKKLKVASKLADQGKTMEFYQNIETVIYQYLADKLNLSHTSIVLDQITPLLTEKGVDQETVDKLAQLFNKCASIRYAPLTDPNKEVMDDLEESRKIIDKIESTISKK